ncbi:major facilitator superfamily domain-containing protein [Myxozyma melibiosi]|uniref:Major facilitator superfamily domain-containing protein n=1 Tax=Myxozyma melibiosi TaxID=54550 RepID=A0ABR1FB55_9ASCO
MATIGEFKPTHTAPGNQLIEDVDSINEKFEEPSNKNLGTTLKDSGDYDPKLQRSLLLKLDLIDRSDIGNAKVAGMTEKLSISSEQYANITSWFQIGYIVFQPVGTLFIRKLRPPFQFSAAMLVWGIITVCIAYAKNYSQVSGLRFLVGCSEAMIQGAFFYLSFWYTYDEMSLRTGIFYSVSALASSFNGLIAYGIEKGLSYSGGHYAWQWIFIIEGILPVGFSFFVAFMLPDIPTRPTFFSKRLFKKEELEYAIKRGRATHNADDAKIRVKQIFITLLRPHFWLLTICYSVTHFSTSSVQNFLPSLIKTLGYTSARAQLFSCICYACAFVTLIIVGYLADRLQQRASLLMICYVVTLVGYILLLAVNNDKVKFAGACLVTAGIYPTVILVIIWTQVVLIGFTRRATALALINSIAQAIGIGGNQAFRNEDNDYRTGKAACVGILCLGVLATALNVMYLKWRNRQKDAQCDSDAANEARLQSWDDLGDDHPDFRYAF